MDPNHTGCVLQTKSKADVEIIQISVTLVRQQIASFQIICLTLWIPIIFHIVSAFAFFFISD